MLIDWLLTALATWGIAALLNHTAFQREPASRATAWMLTVGFFLVALVVMTILQILRYQALSAELGHRVRPPQALDFLGAFFCTNIFFALLKKQPKGGTPAADRPAAPAVPAAPPPLPSGRTDVALPPVEPTGNADAAFRVSSTLPAEKPAVSMPSSSTPSPALPAIEEQAWATALAEVDGPDRRPGVWAKCFALANGVEAQAKATYLKERVAQLLEEHQQRESEKRAQQALELAAQAQAMAVQQAEVARIQSSYVAGKSPSEEEVMILAVAAQRDPKMVRLWERFRGETLLHWAARYGLAAEARSLLALGADPCAANSNGQQPYMLCTDRALRSELQRAAGRGEDA